jgi:N-acetylglucosamine repressor
LLGITGRPDKATMRGTRGHNEHLVLATIHSAGRISRADVARVTDLTRTTVSTVVDALIAAGLCEEVGRGRSTGGKAPTLVEVPAQARLLLGLDVGDRLFSAALVDLHGRIIDRVDVPSEGQDGQAALDVAMVMIDQLLAGVRGRVLGVGIGTPGLVDSSSGTIVQASERRWRQVPLGPMVSERFGLPVYVVNDSQAAGLAVYALAPNLGWNVVTIKVGHGIGAGLVLNGALLQGDPYGAGEIGHTVVDPHGERCRCGRYGCLETVASLRTVLARLSTCLGHEVSLDEAVARFVSGDPPTCSVVVEAGRRLGTALAGLVGMLHVRRIVLAGTMTAFGQPWLDAVVASASRNAFGPLVDDTTFELSDIDNVVVLGSAALLLMRELGLDLRPVGESGRHAPVMQRLDVFVTPDRNNRFASSRADPHRWAAADL